MRGLTGKPFNVNLFLPPPGQADPALRNAPPAGPTLGSLFAEFGAEPPVRLKNSTWAFLGPDPAAGDAAGRRPECGFISALPPRETRVVPARSAGGGHPRLVCTTTPEEAALWEAASASRGWSWASGPK